MKYIRICAFLLLAAASMTLWSNRAEGQAVTATLVGTITDSAGATVAHAPVIITNEDTGMSSTGASNDSGNYEFTFLQPGRYKVSVSPSGFKRIDRLNVEVQVNTTIRVDFILHPGSTHQTVIVTGAPPLLETDRADVSDQIDSKQLEYLPAGARSNFQTLQWLTPGVSAAASVHSSFYNPQDTLNTEVNGVAGMGNSLQFEGLDDNEFTNELNVYIPPTAAIQTVNLSTSNYAPEFGRATGAVVNVILKSGTNQFHGSAYEYNQISALAARSYFNHSSAFPRSTYNYYGATLGGPIVKNNTFFFGDFLRVSNILGQFITLSLPTAAFRNGDLSASPTPIYDPQTGNADGTGRLQFDYGGTPNVIDPNRIDPISQRILALVPLPNVPGAKFTNNYQANTSLNTDNNSYDVKVNHQMAGSDMLIGRFSWQRSTTYQQPVFGMAGGPAEGGFEGTGIDTVYTPGIEYTHVFSPTLLTELRGGIDHYHNEARPSDYGTDATTAIGIPGVNINPITSGLTSIHIGGFSGPLVGWNNNIPFIFAETDIDFVNNWTKLHGNHSIKLGFEVRNNRLDNTSGQDGPRGNFNFAPGPTSLNSPTNKNSFANSMASFLLDIPSSVARDVNINTQSMRQTLYFAFAQDVWQATRNLTLTYGLRWEMYPAITTPRKGGMSQYDPSNNTLLIAGYGNVPNTVGVNTRWADFEPRLGFAYRALPRTVIRGGGGVSRTSWGNNTYAFNYPVVQNVQFTSLSSYTQAVLANGTPASMTTGFPPPVSLVIPADGMLPAPLNQGFVEVNPKYRDPAVISYSLAVEQQIGARWTATIAYVGNKGRNIPYGWWDLNAGVIPGAGVLGQPYYKRYGITSSILLFGKEETSLYNSLQARLTHRFHSGLSVTSAFTWQKAMGYASSTSGLDGPNFYTQPWRDYAELSWNRSITSVNSFIYELPFGERQHFLNRGLLGKIVGGWQVSGIVSFLTGTPLFFSADSSQLNDGDSQVPNENAPFHKLYGIGTQTHWFDTSAFSQPVGPVLGNVGKNIYSGPGSAAFDASGFRTFSLSERLRLQFRADGFNAFNHPTFGNPNVSLTSPGFGKVLGSGGGRVLQLSANLSF